MANYVNIPLKDFEDFILPLGFQDMTHRLERVKEKVFGKVVKAKGRVFSVRVYSSIANGSGRDSGKDAIRVEVWTRNKDHKPVRLGGCKRVHRVEGWRDNLHKRLETAAKKYVDAPDCPACGNPMALREPRKGKKHKPFYGCTSYPDCKATRPA